MHFGCSGGVALTMVVVEVWTGGAASALRSALRMTNDEFARELGTAVRTVAKWNVEPSVVPITEMQRALDTLLRMATPEVQERFVAAVNAHWSTMVSLEAPFRIRAHR